MSKSGILLNRIRYTIYAPIYDLLVKPVFQTQRKKSIDNLRIKNDSKVLLIGAGTGLDFEFLKDKSIEIYAGDITSAMVTKMRSKASKMNLNSKIDVMDGQRLNYENESFDHVILHLILAVIPDPEQCIKEVERVSKPGASIAVFDKFIPPRTKASLTRKTLNLMTRLLFSDITRDIETIISKTELIKVSDTPAAFGGNFRIIELKK